MSKRDAVTWNAIIAAHTPHGQGREAFAYFDQMWQAGIQPDGATFVSILSACMDETSLAEGQKIHFVVQESGYECDVMVATAIVSMYGRCKSIHDAQAAFGQMNARNEVSWNAMIAIYAHFERFEDVLDHFDRMQQDDILPDHVTLVTVLSVCIHKFAISAGTKLHAYIIETGCHPDVVLNTMILNMYGKLGSLYDAQRIFERMRERNTVSWNTMIAVCTQHGSAMGAFTTFNQMQAEGITSNKITYINVLGACSHSGLQQEAYWYFKVMMEIHSSSLAVDHYICFIDLFARSGCLHEAELTVSNMPVQPSAVSFMALLGACRYKDDIQQAEETSKYVFELDPGHYGSHLVLSSLYSSTW
jgi:pentatricopeptide repeat protein